MPPARAAADEGPLPKRSARGSFGPWLSPRLPIGKRAEMFIQRYIQHFPAAGEIVIFDRSWYNRAGVEYVMGFCTPEEHKRFLSLCPQIEKYIVDAGITLVKLWLEVGMEEQEKRFAARIDDPLRQWKLSPMDVKSYQRWYDYSKARDLMFEATNSKQSPWLSHSLGRQAARPAELHLPSAEDDFPQACLAGTGQTAGEIRQEPVRRSGHFAQMTFVPRNILNHTPARASPM